MNMVDYTYHNAAQPRTFPKGVGLRDRGALLFMQLHWRIKGMRHCVDSIPERVLDVFWVGGIG